MGKAEQLTHAERMSILGHYVSDTWGDMKTHEKILLRDISTTTFRLFMQLEQMRREAKDTS